MTGLDQIRGIYPMLYAFFDRAGALDEAALRRQVDAAVANGAHGVAILGLASEVGKLSIAERYQFLDVVADHLGPRLPLCVTIAEATVAGQAEFVQAAADAGASWATLQPPPGVDASEDDLIRFFGAVADRSPIPLAIQNAPEYLGIGLSDEGLATLHRLHPNIALLKAEGSALRLARMIETTEGVFRVFNGRGGLELVDSLRAGCVGLIPGADLFDRQARIYELFAAGQEGEADLRFSEILPLISFLMASIGHLMCYGKRLAARRLWLPEVHDRGPADAPHSFGLSLLEHWSANLEPFNGIVRCNSN
jgi:4-hydroxy-tetrahydrodipicolinate synthase